MRKSPRRAIDPDDPWGFGVSDGTFVEMRLDVPKPVDLTSPKPVDLTPAGRRKPRAGGWSAGAAPPGPVDPAPTDPGPADSGFTDPALTDPALADPALADPAPVMPPRVLVAPDIDDLPLHPVLEPTAFGHRPRRHVARTAAMLTVLVCAGAWAYLRWPIVAGALEAWAPVAASAGTLVLSSQPPGAHVVVDGEAAGVTPLALSLAPGTHDVVATAANGVSQQLRAGVEAGQSTARHLVLEPAPSAVSRPTGGATGSRAPIAAAPPAQGPTGGPNRSALNQGTAPRGPAPPASATPERPASRAAAPERRAAGSSAGSAAGVPPLAGEAPVPGVTNGWVSFSLPFDAQVYEGTTFLGLSTTDRLYARPGRHTYTLVNEQLGFRADESVIVGQGRVTRRAVDPGTATISVQTQPPSEVVIAGRSFGVTPVANISLPLGVHQVTLRHPSLGERVLPVTVRRGEANRLTVDLAQE